MTSGSYLSCHALDRSLIVDVIESLYCPAFIVMEFVTITASKCLFFTLAISQSIRNDAVPNDPLRFSAGSGMPSALPLPINTKFVHAEVQRLPAEFKPDLVLAAWQ